MASILLPVPQILQNPELPNGCEITSCCEVLHYLGFAPDKCELADYYLPRSAQWYGADPDEVYMGNPHLDDGSPETGYYCFAGPIVQAANAYLAVQGSRCRAYDLTGAEEAELASQLQAGNPVIFWATLHFGDIQHDPCGEYDLPGGRRHKVLHTLHSAGLVLAVVSNSSVEVVDGALQQCGIRPYFQQIFSGWQIPQCKPDPYLYRQAMQAFGLSPETCLVVEDSPVGIRAGRGTGLPVAALRDRDGLIDQSEADVVLPTIQSLLQLPCVQQCICN